MQSLRQRSWSQGSVAILTVVLSATACTPGVDGPVDSATESSRAQSSDEGLDIPEVGFVWGESPQISLRSPEGTFLRAMTESLTLLSKTEDPGVVYPGMAGAIDTGAGSDNSRVSSLLSRENGNGVKLKGAVFLVYLCLDTRGLAVADEETPPGKFRPAGSDRIGYELKFTGSSVLRVRR